MGLDLTIVIDNHHGLDMPWFLATERLSFDRDYDIFHQIAGHRDSELRQVCDPKPLPKKIKLDWYGDEGLEKITKDPYGSPLTYVTAEEMSLIQTGNNTSVYNKAIMAFVRALPKGTMIVLYWS